MPNAFNFGISPFDCLGSEERRLVRDSLDIAYFREGETILAPGAAATRLYVIVKGHVAEYDGDEQVANFGPDDTFDGRSLVAGRASTRFVCAEEVVAYELAREAVNTLIGGNANFGALLFSDLSRKLGALAERHQQREMQALAMARVDEAYLRPAYVVDASTDIVEVARLFQQHRTTCVLVQDPAGGKDATRMGIYTTTGLQRAILDGRPLSELTVGELATYPLVTIRPEAPIFDALALLIKHRVHRLVVADGDRVLGVLEQLDALSFLSNHSYLITVQVAEAQDLESLEKAAQQITRLIALLDRGGTRVGQIARLVKELNGALFERTWQLAAPAELVAASCLFVMGSEGRGEQLLKTDQDNGLVIRDDFRIDPAELAAACDRFSGALRRFGYPDCPGRIMVSNPAWRRSVSEFSQEVRGWLMRPDPERLMSLAIFLDAHAVCGDASLLATVRAEVDGLVASDDAMLGRFAGAIDAFPEAGPSAWWNRLFLLGENDAESVDLKKAGIFPLVHGARSLALEHHVGATGTIARLDALFAAGCLPRDVATDLGEALGVLMSIKLRAGLLEIDAGRPVSGLVRLKEMSSLDRDLLKDALAAVKRFRALVRHRYHLDG